MSVAGASSHQSRRGLVLFMDWDETISAHDTLSSIAPPEGEQGRGPPFAWYGERYMADLRTYEEEWAEGRQGQLDEEKAGVRDDLGPAWSEQWRFLTGLDAVELASQRRIEEGGLFVGFDPAAMEGRARKEVKLTPGWSDFVSKRLGGWSVEWHVISVGWSARFIGAALAVANTDLPPATICANEVELDTATGRATGRLTKSRDALHVDGQVRQGIRTAPHKLREMRRILKAREEQERPITIYFGDSPTDLVCLVEATVGVILGGKGGMRRAIEKADFARFLCDGDVAEKQEYVRRHLTEARSCRTETPPCLITASDWDEIDGVMEVICTALQ